MTPVILIVLDGYGIAPPGPGNAIQLSGQQTLNSLMSSYPNTTLKASGISVGLPQEEAGNTEVGHLNLGAGRVVYQDLPRINMSIADGDFYKTRAFIEAVEHVKATGGKLHLLGLVGNESSVRVHSSVDHLYALLFFAKENGLKNVFVHAITDGRDSPPKSASMIIQQLETKMHQMGVGTIATILGRYYAMDRDKRWERIEKAYTCLTKGSSTLAKSALDLINDSYEKGLTDEFIIPTSLQNTDSKPVALIEKGDAVIFFNYRIDRPRELTKAFVLDDFEGDANTTFSFDPYAVKYTKSHLHEVNQANPPFARGPKIENLCFVTMTEYEKNLTVSVAFPPIVIKMPLGQVIAESSMEQLRMSESEKERFVTFYFNGQQEQPFAYEERIIIPSPKVATYDLKPEMSAVELTNELITRVSERKYKFILVNFANLDMVGHTGNIQATILAMKTVDESIRRILKAALNAEYTVLITADHGNAEQKINPETGGVSTEHTNNPVPFIVVGKQFEGKYIKLQTGILADVAPTILYLLGIPKTEDMTGRDLLEEVRPD